MAEIEKVGVLGAGTMGTGIAQLACTGGFETVMVDPDREALTAAAKSIDRALVEGTERGRWDERDAEAASARLTTAASPDDLSGCDLVIEAVPEDLALKREILAEAARACRDDAILATNTSSLSVTAISSGMPAPDRIIGMHFFNPPQKMRLVEIVAGSESSGEALAAGTEVARRMDRSPVEAADEIGFIANRCARPYSLEAVRMLGAGIATHEQIDRICRIGAGFRMGPFELADLIGLDVTLEVAESFWEQSFHEPRWQPHPIQARMVASGRLGRKTGRGYYDYRDGPHRPDDPPDRAVSEDAPPDEPTTQRLRSSNLLAVSLERGSLEALYPGQDAVGYVALPDLTDARLVELTRSPSTTERTADAAESHFRAIGKHVEWVADAPGLVLGRIVAQLANEAHFALGAGVATSGDIDTAMRLGLNHPRGPFEWTELIGAARLVGILDALHAELGEERYRVAPALRAAAVEAGAAEAETSVEPRA